MPTVTFSQKLGLSRVAMKTPPISSGDALDHALRIAGRDASAKGFKASAANAKEIGDLYNAVIKDGRYLHDLPHDPSGVAAKLGKSISPSAAAEIIKAGGLAGVHVSRGGEVMGTVTVVCIAVVVVLCARTGPDASHIIVDRSGSIKF